MVNEKKESIKKLINLGFHPTKKFVLLGVLIELFSINGSHTKLIKDKFNGKQLTHVCVGDILKADVIYLFSYNQFLLGNDNSDTKRQKKYVTFSIILVAVKLMLGSISLYFIAINVGKSLIQTGFIILFIFALMSDRIFRFFHLSRSQLKIHRKLMLLFKFNQEDNSTAILLVDSGLGVWLGHKHILSILPNEISKRIQYL